MPWLDAAWHPAGWIDGPVPFDVADRGLLLGDGVFDTSLVLGGRMVWRAAHLARLRSHAAVLGFDVEAARLEAAVDGALATLAGGHAALRITVTRGPGPRGLAPTGEARPTILAAVAPLTSSSLFAPVRLHPTTVRRNESSPLSRVKSLGYGDAVLAAAEARAAGFDDAVFLNGAGHVACAGTANVFAIFGRELATPPLEDGILDGIARRVLLAAAEDIGLVPVERSLTLGELEAAPIVVCTSSLRLVSVVTALGVAPKGDEGSGDLAARLAEAVFADVGVDPRSATA